MSNDKSDLCKYHFGRTEANWRGGRTSNATKMDQPSHGGRVSRAGRRLRSVGEWWREPRRTGPSNEESGRRAEAAQPKNAGWLPAFEKTLVGSGPRPGGIRKHRGRNRLSRRLVPGAGFIRCAPVDGNQNSTTFGQGTDAPAPLDVMSPQLRTPCNNNVDALASALRAQKMQDDTSTTPTRRVLNINSSSSSSSMSISGTRSRAVETTPTPNGSSFLPVSSAGAALCPQTRHWPNGV